MRFIRSKLSACESELIEENGCGEEDRFQSVMKVRKKTSCPMSKGATAFAQQICIWHKGIPRCRLLQGRHVGRPFRTCPRGMTPLPNPPPRRLPLGNSHFQASRVHRTPRGVLPPPHSFLPKPANFLERMPTKPNQRASWQSSKGATRLRKCVLFM